MVGISKSGVVFTGFEAEILRAKIRSGHVSDSVFEVEGFCRLRRKSAEIVQVSNFCVGYRFAYRLVCKHGWHMYL